MLALRLSINLLYWRIVEAALETLKMIKAVDSSADLCALARDDVAAVSLVFKTESTPQLRTNESSK